MHIFHKWKEESKDVVETRWSYFGKSSNIDAILVVKKCSICNKRKAFILYANGNSQGVSIDYVDCIRKECEFLN